MRRLDLYFPMGTTGSQVLGAALNRHQKLLERKRYAPAAAIWSRIECFLSRHDFRILGDGPFWTLSRSEWDGKH